MQTKTHKTLFRTTVLGLGLAIGCAVDSDGREMGGPGPLRPDDDGTGWGGDDGGDDGWENFDVAGGDGTGNGGDNQDDGCKKVDLLFVIDNSGSMEDEQQNLIGSFPSFIEGIKTELADTNGYQVGVITSDAYQYNETGCTNDGALVTQTGGANSSNTSCGPFAAGGRFMTELDDLNTKFGCAAQVGTGGDGDEHPMQTLQVALSTGMNGAGACNEGFIRNDALLVVVIITDEEDDHETMGCVGTTNSMPLPGSPADPGFWFDTVVGAKGGIESNVVVLSLVGPDGSQSCPPLDKCGGGIQGAEQATRILDFTRRFTHGFVGQVCAPDYGPFFTEAVGIIESACEEYQPPG